MKWKQINFIRENKMQFNINGYIKFKSEKQFVTYCDERGIKQNGFETATHLREILIGKPKFNERFYYAYQLCIRAKTNMKILHKYLINRHNFTRKDCSNLLRLARTVR
jgi:hypothetical protein